MAKIKSIKQYNKKYKKIKPELLQFTKKELEEQAKINNCELDFLLKGRKWIKIKDTYCEIPRFFSSRWIKSLHIGFKILGTTILAGGVAAGVAIPTYNIIVEQRFIDAPIIEPSIKEEADIKLEEKTKDGNIYEIYPKNPSLKSITKIDKVTKGGVTLEENKDYKYELKTSPEGGSSIVLTIFPCGLNKHKGEIVIYPEVNYVDFNIAVNVENGSYSGESKIKAIEGKADITITPDSGYKLPDVVEVMNADSTYDKNSGVVHLKNATNNVNISCTCVTKKFSITPDIRNGSTEGDTEIQEDVGTASVTIVPSDGYKLPPAVNVTGANYTYDATSGVISLNKATSDVSIYCECPILEYNVGTSLQHCTCSGLDTKIQAKIGEKSGTLTAESGYQLPESISATNAEIKEYNSSTGAFTIYNATGDVTVNSTAEVLKYNINGSITNGFIPSDQKIQAEVGTADITITPDEGYKLPESVTVDGASNTYDSSTGVVHLSNAKGNVTITADCPELKYNVTTSLTNCDCSELPSEIQAKIGEISGTLTAKDGYKLPESISATNAEVKSYDSSSGAFTINNATGDVIVTSTAEELKYNITGSITYGSIPTDQKIQAKIGSADITITPDDGYKLPDSVTVSGADSDYDSSTGVVHLSNATGDVTITADCPELKYNVSTGSLEYCGCPHLDTEIQAKVGVANGTLLAEDGYQLPTSINVTNADVKSYDPTSGQFTINNATGDVIVSCTAIELNYTVSSEITDGTSSGITEIQAKVGIGDVNIVPNPDHKLPETVDVTNATCNYDAESGIVHLSNATGNVTITATCPALIEYNITKTLTHCTTDLADKIKENDSIYGTITPESGYKLPDTITVTGATSDYNSSTGAITLSNPTSDVVVTVDCPPLTEYNITKTLTNCTTDLADTIQEGGSISGTITPQSGYKLPDTITVTGATSDYNSSTGAITLSNPTGAVEVICVCVATKYTITGNITNGTFSGETEILVGGEVDVTITPDDGYKLPGSVTVVGATSSYDSSTGVVHLSNATSDVTVTATCPIIAEYTITKNLTGCTCTDIPDKIKEGNTATGTITPSGGYNLATSITVNGATLDSYDTSSGVFTISNPTSDVTITAECIERKITPSVSISQDLEGIVSVSNVTEIGCASAYMTKASLNITSTQQMYARIILKNQLNQEILDSSELLTVGSNKFDVSLVTVDNLRNATSLTYYIEKSY